MEKNASMDRKKTQGLFVLTIIRHDPILKLLLIYGTCFPVRSRLVIEGKKMEIVRERSEGS